MHSANLLQKPTKLVVASLELDCSLLLAYTCTNGIEVTATREGVDGRVCVCVCVCVCL